MTVEQLKLAKAEHDAWLKVVQAWPDNINETKHELLLREVLLWAEHLAALRRTQSELEVGDIMEKMKSWASLPKTSA